MLFACNLLSLKIGKAVVIVLFFSFLFLMDAQCSVVGGNERGLVVLNFQNPRPKLTIS